MAATQSRPFPVPGNAPAGRATASAGRSGGAAPGSNAATGTHAPGSSGRVPN